MVPEAAQATNCLNVDKLIECQNAIFGEKVTTLRGCSVGSLAVLPDLAICSKMVTAHVKLRPKFGFGYISISATFRKLATTSLKQVLN